MQAWLLDGLMRYLPPDRCEVLIYLDGCTDDCPVAMESLRYYFLANFRHNIIVNPAEIGEIRCHVEILKEFMKSTCDVCVIFQDDQRLEWPILESLDKIYDQYGDAAGLIGGRDGYERGFSQMVGSAWSHSVLTRKLAVGEWAERTCLNSGPVVYSRKMIEKIGLPDGNFKAFYAWDDYGLRAKSQGFTNLVLGTDISHIKFGRVCATKMYTNEISAHDSSLLHSKWPK